MAPEAAKSPRLWLIAESGTRTPYQPRFGSQIAGRGKDVDLTIPSGYASSRHAELYWDGAQLLIRDLGSSNGTTVNGAPISDWVVLHEGDTVQIGPIQAIVEADGPSSSQPEPAVNEAPRPAVSPESRLSRVPIFLSHSSEDKRAVRVIASYLERRGWTVWIDEAGIAGGKDFRAELMQALEATWVVVLIVSYPAMQSKWVTREINAADRLGLEVIPVSLDQAPYPDPLRLVLAGVQQIDLGAINDPERRNQQLARLDNALILAGQRIGRTRPGTAQIVIGSFIRAIGVTGFLIGFALFALLGFATVNSGSAGGNGVPTPFIGWGVGFVSIIVAAIGEGLRRSGMRRGI